MKPLNSHVLIDPLPMESFIAPTKDTYEEIGIVLEVADGLNQELVGKKVYFDSWQASKYPKDTNGNFHWLVPYESVKAYE